MLRVLRVIMTCMLSWLDYSSVVPSFVLSSAFFYLLSPANSNRIKNNEDNKTNHHNHHYPKPELIANQSPLLSKHVLHNLRQSNYINYPKPHGNSALIPSLLTPTRSDGIPSNSISAFQSPQITSPKCFERTISPINRPNERSSGEREEFETDEIEPGNFGIGI